MNNLMERLRRQAQAAKENSTHIFALPNYNGLLLCEYEVLERDIMRKKGKAIQAQFRDEADQRYWAQVDTLIEACVMFYVDEDNGKGPVPLHEHPDVNEDAPIGYDANLARFLGLQLEQPRARAVVEGVFLHNEISLTKHWVEVTEWMSDTSQAVVEEEVGESVGEMRSK